MDFYQGGLFAYNRDECCFIKYLIDIIKSAQLRLKNDQWDINMDFEECISSIRKYGEPLCINYWYKMVRDQRSEYLRTSSEMTAIQKRQPTLAFTASVTSPAIKKPPVHGR